MISFPETHEPKGKDQKKCATHELKEHKTTNKRNLANYLLILTHQLSAVFRTTFGWGVPAPPRPRALELEDASHSALFERHCLEEKLKHKLACDPITRDSVHHDRVVCFDRHAE